MESDPTETLELAEFKQIIINTIHINLHDYRIEEEGEQESKHNEDQENFKEEGSEAQQTWRIESIKDIIAYKRWAWHHWFNPKWIGCSGRWSIDMEQNELLYF